MKRYTAVPSDILRRQKKQTMKYKEVRSIVAKSLYNHLYSVYYALLADEWGDGRIRTKLCDTLYFVTDEIKKSVADDPLLHIYVAREDCDPLLRFDLANEDGVDAQVRMVTNYLFNELGGDVVIKEV